MGLGLTWTSLIQWLDMATIRRVIKKGKQYGWQVKIRRVGVPSFTLVFVSYDEACEWAQEHEWQYVRNPDRYRDIDRLALRRERERKRGELADESHEC